MISVLILLATIVFTVLEALDEVRACAAGGFAVLTVVVGDALLKQLSRYPPPAEHLWILVGSTLAASVVLIFRLQLAALAVIATPLLVVPQFFVYRESDWW